MAGSRTRRAAEAVIGDDALMRLAQKAWITYGQKRRTTQASPFKEGSTYRAALGLTHLLSRKAFLFPCNHLSVRFVYKASDSLAPFSVQRQACVTVQHVHHS